MRRDYSNRKLQFEEFIGPASFILKNVINKAPSISDLGNEMFDG